MKIRFLLLFSFFFYFSSLSADEPLPKREMRGVWIATVANIDWPSRAGLPVTQQKQELLTILDNHQRAGMNAVFLQIRPSADAFYAISTEPWSRFLTGVQGKIPGEGFDPLQFAIEQAHLRGMELHPWFNPYRATFDLVRANVHADHITNRRPDWFFTYGGKKWFDPGIPEVRDYIVGVIMNVVNNYDIDGVHFDDYFYPYPDGNRPLPDDQTYKKYGTAFKDKADWRRDNVNTLIKTLADSIRTEKPYLRFGISPFGIWDNKRNHPDGSETNGFSGYRQLYADALTWAREGWVDYLMPQLYFPFQHRLAAYETLVDWWGKNTYGRHLYIGHASYRASDNGDGWQNRSQIPDQIRYLRDNPASQGSVFYSSKSIAGNLAGLRDSLQYDLYKYRALPPSMPWLDSIPPAPPQHVLVRTVQNQEAVMINWLPPLAAADGEYAFGYVIYRFNEGEEINIDNPQNILHITYNGKQTTYTDYAVRRDGEYIYVVTSLDRIKNESEVARFNRISMIEAKQEGFLNSGVNFDK